jgi:DNA invertase Pin-like site-specific DNA recombinase
VDFISLGESIDTSTPMEKMIFTVLASPTELERSIITERVHAGVNRARKEGKVFDRPRVIVERRSGRCTRPGRAAERSPQPWA